MIEAEDVLDNAAEDCFEPTDDDLEKVIKVLEDRNELEDFYNNQISEVYVVLPPEPSNDDGSIDEMNQMMSIYASMIGLERIPGFNGE